MLFTPTQKLDVTLLFNPYPTTEINPTPTSENCSKQGIATFMNFFSYQIFVRVGPNNGTCFGTYATYPSISPPASGTVIVINTSNGVRIIHKK